MGNTEWRRCGERKQQYQRFAHQRTYFYNAGLVPIPVLVSIFHSTDFTKRVPIGWAPELYRANGGDIYDIGDQLIIGSDTYLILPKYGPGIGNTSYGDYLFKLGA